MCASARHGKTETRTAQRRIPAVLRDISVDSAFDKLLYCKSLNVAAPVAQLDRASVYGTEGHKFESCQAHFTRR